MKLSEIKTENNFVGLLMGQPGAGKTCFAASFPYPMLYLDFDNKVDSAALFFKGDKERLDNIDVRQLSPRLNASPIDTLNKIIAEELIPQQNAGELKFKTLVLDSISAFSSSALNHIITTNPGIAGRQTAQGKMPDKPHYGILGREFAKLIPGIASLKCNVLMCAHIETYKDDTTGTIIRAPMMDGSYSDKLPQVFKEVWHLYVDDKGKHMAQTKSDSKFSTLRSQITGLPAHLCVDNGYADLEKYLK